MFPRIGLLRTMLFLFAAGAVAGALVLLSSYARSVRPRMIGTTAAEIQRGNYFAWMQARHWEAVLTIEERRTLGDACRQYARGSDVLYAKGNTWPPDSARSRVLRLPIRPTFGRDDRSLDLRYTVICYPATHQIPVVCFDRMIHDWK